MIRISADALAYACASSGKCCQGWPIGFDREAAERIPTLLKGIPRYEGKTLLTEGHPGSLIHHKLAACDDHGRCIFLNDDRLCDLHARFGPQAKSLVARQYPHLAMATPLRTSITMTYSCPSACKRLLDPGPFRIVDDPPEGVPEMAYVRQVPAHYHVQLKAGAPLTWEAFGQAEAGILGRLAGGEGDPAEDLLGTWLDMEGVPRPAFSAGDAGALARLLFDRCRASDPWQEDRARLEALAAFEPPRDCWRNARPEAAHALRRYAAAKSFGNMAFVTHGIIPGFQIVLLLVHIARREAARRAGGEPIGPVHVAEAAETADRLFPHESGMFAFLGRAEAAAEHVAPRTSAALILALT